MLRCARRPVTPERGRTVGITTVAFMLALAAAPVLAGAVPLGAWALPRVMRRRAERGRVEALEADLPQVVDLLTLAVGAGLTVSLAVAAAGRRGRGPLAAELRRVTAEAGRGRRLADALDDLPGRTIEAVRPLSSALGACERYGAPVGPALDRIAVDVRLRRQRRAEEAARRVPVLMLFPLVLCILPAFALLTVAPLIAGALRALRF